MTIIDGVVRSERSHSMPPADCLPIVVSWADIEGLGGTRLLLHGKVWDPHFLISQFIHSKCRFS